MLLDRQGAKTLEASQMDEASEIAEQEQPDLIVYDADCDRSPGSEVTRRLTLQASRSAIPIVVLGTVRRDSGGLLAGNLVTKPYHYGPLLRKIEELLGSRV